MNQIQVLIVEDNDTDAAFITDVLESQGNGQFLPDRVSSLSEAKNILRNKNYTVIILDLLLPDSKGLETCIALRTSFPEIPMVVLSALNDNQLAYEVVRQGAQDYLIKGIVSGDSIIRCLKYAVERKRLEFAAQQIARQVFLHAPGSIIRFDQNFMIVETNVAFLNNFDVSADTVKGKSLFDFFLGIPRDELAEALSDGNSYAIDEQFLEFPDRVTNRVSIANLSVWPIIDEKSQFTGGIMMLEDITDRYELARQRDAVMAIIAHDLKNPLLGSQRIYELLLNNNFGLLNDHQQDAIKTLSRANSNCLHILKNLLQLFSYTRGEEVLLLKEQDLVPIIEGCLKEWEATAMLNKQTIVCDLKSGDLKSVSADIQAISYLLNNLVSNALKYSPPGGKIVIKGENDNERVKLFVCDNGPGVPAEVENELFKPFGRGRIGNLQSASSGLGLFLCNQIMLTHQGAIQYCPNIPTGSTFILNFPIYQSVN